MKEQISTLILIFDIAMEGGKWTAKLAETKRVFPTVFCRQMDFM